MSAADIPEPVHPAISPRWRLTLLLVAAVIAWVLICFGNTFQAMAAIWARSETFTHGFVVPPIALWLIWRRRQHLAALSPRPSAWVILPLALAGFGWLLGELAAVNSVTQLAATAVLVLGVVTVVGTRVAWAMAFPLAFLFFAVPIGEFFMPRLMEWTADFTVLGLRFSGVPVYREGLSFIIPSGSWSVVEACSGVRYLIASLMVGTLFAYLNYRSPRRRLIFIMVSALVPIAANWVRAYIIVMLGHLSGNKLAAGVDHLIYGWVFFGVVIMLMFFIGARWSEDTQDMPAVADGSQQAAGESKGEPYFVIVALLLAIAWPQLANLAIEHSDESNVPQLAQPPATLPGGWQLAAADTVDFSPAYENPSSSMAARYARDGNSVGLFIGYYRNQTYGQKLVTSTNNLVRSNDQAWKVTERAGQTITVDGKSVWAHNYRVARDPLGSLGVTTRLRVWQWYWINGRLTANDYEAKLLNALSRLRGDGDDSAVVIVHALDDPAGQGSDTLAAFVADTGSAVEQMLRQTRERR